LSDLKLYDAEFKFADIVWKNEPVQSGELARLCEKELGWKRTTTYTVLKKLCDRGILKNDSSTVTSLVPRDAVLRYESRTVMDKTFGGSLPAFITAFLSGGNLSDREAEELKSIIDRYREGSQ
jgi:predicted transcriptional regulator